MSWMIYGANGYTGRLAATESVRRGMRPILGGRNEAAIAQLAEELGLEFRVFTLDDPNQVRQAINGLKLVLHCAGPFSISSQPMISACLAEGVHYLDITGEISVFANAHQQDEQARHADVVLLPGAGFDVVPSDCLAASLVDALPAATKLQLAFEVAGGPSPGTAKTSIEGLGKGGWIRRDGKLKKVPLAWKTRTIPFAHAERTGCDDSMGRCIHRVYQHGCAGYRGIYVRSTCHHCKFAPDEMVPTPVRPSTGPVFFEETDRK